MCYLCCVILKTVHIKIYILCVIIIWVVLYVLSLFVSWLVIYVLEVDHGFFHGPAFNTLQSLLPNTWGTHITMKGLEIINQ